MAIDGRKAVTMLIAILILQNAQRSGHIFRKLGQSNPHSRKRVMKLLHATTVLDSICSRVINR